MRALSRALFVTLATTNLLSCGAAAPAQPVASAPPSPAPQAPTAIDCGGPRVRVDVGGGEVHEVDPCYAALFLHPTNGAPDIRELESACERGTAHACREAARLEQGLGRDGRATYERGCTLGDAASCETAAHLSTDAQCASLFRNAACALRRGEACGPVQTNERGSACRVPLTWDDVPDESSGPSWRALLSTASLPAGAQYGRLVDDGPALLAPFDATRETRGGMVQPIAGRTLFVDAPGSRGTIGVLFYAQDAPLQTLWPLVPDHVRTNRTVVSLDQNEVVGDAWYVARAPRAFIAVDFSALPAPMRASAAIVGRAIAARLSETAAQSAH